ncbi:MAG: SDR family oxidoreductase [Deltaproteobacteria bacterium]|nr:SDR family oxidoreductase [Deltaproteobacteria bacterium]
MSPAPPETVPVLVTGAGGYIGSLLMETMAAAARGLGAIVALDFREIPPVQRLPGVHYVTADIRSPELGAIFMEYRPRVVVHLASIVTPGKKSDRAFEYAVDVEGTENVLKSCLEAGVEKIIVTSSGASYGYHPDNPERISETDPLRGNPEFAYSDHKRLVEEMLRRYREGYPELKQLILRPGTILGKTTSNQITALFEKPFILGVRGAAIPFVFIWDRDVVACIMKGIHEGVTGIYNLAGDGVLSMKEIAALLGKPYLPLPVSLLHGVLWVLKRLHLTRYGPEQVNFLRYRPVLDNRRLKEAFGYTPQMTTRQVFDFYLREKK